MPVEAYIRDQLIPYIGNKRKLLPLLREAICFADCPAGTFLDLFSGSSVVSRLAKVMGFQVIANDWEPYTGHINRAYISNNVPPSFVCLGGMQSAFDRLNSLNMQPGYISRHYCPQDDENPDLDRERMFYTQENGRRIDTIREQIAAWKIEGFINDDEESVLLAPLIYQAAYCSNTSGVFKGFHRGWGGATRTAWYRIRSVLTLRPPVFYDNGRSNSFFQEDAEDVAARTECDIAYIDPPYNQHQYGANYHMLNTVALWDKPPLEPLFENGSKKRDKVGIRKDWRTQRRSLYCRASAAGDAVERLISKVRARKILVSYSTDGIIPVRRMLAALSDRGSLTLFTHRYKRYRVSSQRPSPRAYTVEFVVVVDTQRPGDIGDLRNVEAAILRQLEGAQSPPGMIA